MATMATTLRDDPRGYAARSARVKRKRRRIYRELAGGKLPLAGLLLDPPAPAARIKLKRVLEAMPGFGPGKYDRLLSRTRISPTARLGELTPGQVDEVLSYLYANHPALVARWRRAVDGAVLGAREG
jgi:hypothetical protein